MNTVLNVGQSYRVTGGADRYMLELERLLADRGHRVVPFAAKSPENLPSEWARFFPEGADFAHPGLLDLARYVYSAPAARAMRRVIDAARPNLAHMHIYYGKLTASILAPLREAKIPIVQTLHEYKLICPVFTMISGGKVCEACDGHHYWRALPRRCNRGSLARTALSVTEAYVSRQLGGWTGVDRFIAVSQFQRDKLVQHGVPAGRICTIHNFVDTARMEPASGAGGYLLYFGRLERVKGIHTLLDAARQVPELPVFLVGEGSEREAIARRLEGPELAHVRLRPFARDDELAGLIRGCVATVLPAEWYENCPLAVLESLGYARPVLATRIGGIPELVEHGVDGFLTPPGDADQLAERMRWLASHKAAAAAMGAVGRDKVVRRFSPEVHYEQLIAVYRAAASERLVGES